MSDLLEAVVKEVAALRQDVTRLRSLEMPQSAGPGGAVPTTRQILAGAGLGGGGNLATDVTLSVNTGDGIQIVADAVAVDASVVRTGSSVIAGAGLTGGGSLGANITLNVGQGDGILVGADAVAVDTSVLRTSQLGAANGIATLGADGKLVAAQVPAIAISDTFVVASQAEMLALSAERGDVAVRTDLNKSFILKTEPASSLSNWQELLTPTDAVSSVNGQTGIVVLDTGDIAEGSNQYFTAARARASISATAPVTYDSGTGAIGLNQAGVDHGSIGGLGDDDHPGHPWLAGRAGGQTLIGGTGAGNNLILGSTTHATRGAVVVRAGDHLIGHSANDDFVSGLAGRGWRLGQDANGEMTSLFLRQALTSTSFVVNQTQGVNGRVRVSKATTLTEAIADSDAAASLVVNKNVFAVNDYVIVSTQAGARAWYKVLGTPLGSGPYTYPVEWKYGSNIAFSAGDAVVQDGSWNGSAGTGLVEITSIDPDSPYLDVIERIGPNYDDVVTRLRLGNLAGINDATFGQLSGYGLYAENVALKGNFELAGLIKGVLNIDTAGGIWQGSAGSFASPDTGFKLYASGGKGVWETWSGGARQVYVDPADMSLRAGSAGDVRLDAQGIRINAGTDYDPTKAYRLIDGSGNVIAQLSARKNVALSYGGFQILSNLTGMGIGAISEVNVSCDADNSASFSIKANAADTGIASLSVTSGDGNKIVSIIGKLDVFGPLTTYSLTGTVPVNVSSTTVCPNLNADLLDGLHASLSGADAHVLATDANGSAALGDMTGVAQQAGIHAHGAYGLQLDNTTAEGVASGGTLAGNLAGLASAADKRLAAFMGGVLNAGGVNRRIAGMTIWSSEAHTDTSNLGAHIRFETIQNGANTTARTERMRLTDDGSLLIGTTTHGMAANGSIAVAKDFAHRGANVGFYNTAPIARPSAYTQTYSTADKTHAARTAAALTNNTGGTISTTLAAITAGASYAQADMTAVKNALASLADQVNKLRTDTLDTAQIVNSVIDDLQAFGLLA